MRSKSFRLAIALLLAGGLLSACQTSGGTAASGTPAAEDPTRAPSGY